jgi:hypothetical protein
MMQMNWQCMNAERRSLEYIAMCCPCSLCRNDKDYSDWGTLSFHLIKNGLMANYVLWTRHGERGVVMEENEDEEDDITFLTGSRGKILQILKWKMLTKKRYRKTAMLMILVKF